MNGLQYNWVAFYRLPVWSQFNLFFSDFSLFCKFLIFSDGWRTDFRNIFFFFIFLLTATTTLTKGWFSFTVDLELSWFGHFVSTILPLHQIKFHYWSVMQCDYYSTVETDLMKSCSLYFTTNLILSLRRPTNDIVHYWPVQLTNGCYKTSFNHRNAETYLKNKI